MKKLICFLVIATFLNSVYCQWPVLYNGKKYVARCESIFKDSSGTVFSFEDFIQAWYTGEYKITPMNADSASLGFFLTKLSSAEQANWLAQTPKPSPYKRLKVGRRFDPFVAEGMNGEIVDLKKL